MQNQVQPIVTAARQGRPTSSNRRRTYPPEVKGWASLAYYTLGIVLTSICIGLIAGMLLR
jgi:hypothetical protein